MDKYAVRGLKKLFSLCATKIRLAREAGTVEVRPAPLPLVKLYGGVELNTVDECWEYRGRFKDGVDYSDAHSVASAALQLADIIEGVKYAYEPLEYMPLIDEEGLKSIEEDCSKTDKPLTILLLTHESCEHSVFIGDNPPPKVRHYSRVISGVAPLLHHLLRSQYFSDGVRLRNVRVHYGGGTLLGAALYHALTFFSE
jgi:hypothetical protein